MANQVLGNSQSATASFRAIDGSAIFLALVVLIVVSALASPAFLSPENIANVLVQSVFVIVVGIGMTYVLISGGIDLSVGSTMGLSAALCMLTLNAGAPLPLAILAGLLGGAAVGLINAVFIVGLGFADFIATLGTASLVRGVVERLTASKALNTQDPSFQALAGGTLAGIPIPVLIVVVVALVTGIVLARTTMGRAIYGVGLNARSSYLAGVLVKRVRVSVYIVSGALAGIAGILLASRLSSVHPALGTGYELTAIAASAVGGTSLAGGRGSVLGTLIGAFFLAVLQNALSLMSVNAFWFQIITGLIIVAAVLLNGGISRLVRSRRTPARV